VMNLVLTKMQLMTDPVTGTPLSKSTLSMILKNRQHHLNIDLNARENWKKKARRQQFPVLESYISEWVYQAQLARVVTSDDVILAVARKFVDEIMGQEKEEGHEKEDNTGFEFSSEWLAGLKNRCGLGRVKTQGETEVEDPEAYGIPAMKVQLRERVKDFAPRDIYNCDELALQ